MALTALSKDHLKSLQATMYDKPQAAAQASSQAAARSGAFLYTSGEAPLASALLHSKTINKKAKIFVDIPFQQSS